MELEWRWCHPTENIRQPAERSWHFLCDGVKLTELLRRSSGRGGTLTAHFLSFSIQITNFPFVKNYPSSSDCRLETAISLFVLFLLPSPAVLALHLFSQTGKTKKFLQRQMEVQTLKRSVQFYIYLR